MDPPRQQRNTTTQERLQDKRSTKQNLWIICLTEQKVWIVLRPAGWEFFERLYYSQLLQMLNGIVTGIELAVVLDIANASCFSAPTTCYITRVAGGGGEGSHMEWTGMLVDHEPGETSWRDQSHGFLTKPLGSIGWRSIAYNNER